MMNDRLRERRHLAEQETILEVFDEVRVVRNQIEFFKKVVEGFWVVRR